MSQTLSNRIGHLSQTAIHDNLVERTITFIWNCLIPWQNDPDRVYVEAEEELNAQFHNFIQAKAVQEFPMVLFQHEQRQEGRRRVDISAKPTNPTIIQGCRYSCYDPFLVIEGKRLPAPDKSREREYVTGDNKITGGIQRFKKGQHGKDHEKAIILAYLQRGASDEWYSTINSWIEGLSESHPEEWDKSELLEDFQNSTQTSRMKSRHPRPQNCQSEKIQLLHFWVQCSGEQSLS